MVKDGVGRGFKKKSKSQFKSVSALMKEAKRGVSNGNYDITLAATREAEKVITGTKRLAREMRDLKKRENHNTTIKTAIKVANANNAKERKLQNLERNLDKAISKTPKNVKPKNKTKEYKTLEVELEKEDDRKY